jgi:hypothetical protein
MSPAPVLAQVISTHGTPAFVHLALESRRRFCPDVAVLVVDDCSTDGDRLAALCANHGVPLVRNPTRLGHQNGDLAAVAHGLRFASDCKADWLLKTSRRFIPLTRWADALLPLVTGTHHHTYTHRCIDYHVNGAPIDFRSECFAMRVAAWHPLIDSLAQGTDSFAEQTLHRLCQQLSHPPAAGRDPGYSTWDFLTSRRGQNGPDFYWHNATPPSQYLALSQQWGLPYGLADFEV